jgi:hypothetical protein
MEARKVLSPDSTVETVWPTLTHPREYVSGVWAKLRECAKKHGEASVRIGVTGTGQKPYYRIFYRDSGEEKIFGSFYDQHDPFEQPCARSNNWSNKSMTLAELESFFRSKLTQKLKA